MGYRVEVRDRNLNRIGELDTWIKLDFVVRHCQAGTWQLLVKDGTDQAKMLQQGGGIVIWQDGVNEPVFSGGIESFQKYWTTQQHTHQGSIYVGGSCDNQMAYHRLAFPEPTLPVPQQYKGRDTRSVSAPAQQSIWWELDHALGPSALPDRRVPGVVVGPRPASGAAVSDSLRYDVLGSKLEEWCKTKKVGYRFLYNPDTKSIDLTTYTPRDRSKDIRFATELGNLREFIYTLSAPKVTRVIVACQGEGKERYIHQKADSVVEAEWGVQIERLVDRRDIPLRTNPAGAPELVVKTTSDGYEDIGTRPDGAEWTTEVAARKKDLAEAEKELAAAEKALADAKTEAEKNAAKLRLVEANKARLNSEAALKRAIRDAKPTIVEHYMDMVKQAADAALKEGEKNGNFQIYPIDTEQCRFGVDYFVGDIVTVAVDGHEYVEIIREVNVAIEDGGKTSITPKIGEQGTGEPLNLYKSVWEMREKLRKLEARL
ncbi:siphovirus ReqiPepy6 Gp37-like family protein [Streptomyces uncialis]|uniref:Gp28/Gp37-like domain-containing protein n=1 Tax=Streptomyces uncialis TaxID=1048205 RepID=A0A1Q4VC77_9ACTN|nr:siphovirus ReqiPepy6 Gp37-like family protein [Streptomyces uncialis]OKH95413.1 hypothetical protein AB852_00655 [Streptomyces uncialis]